MTASDTEETNKRIATLEKQVRELQEAHTKFVAHYHEFVKATVLHARETSEE